MKKILTAVLCAALALSMTFTSFGAEEKDSSFSLSDLGDALSSLFSDLSESIPEVVASIEEAIPAIADSLKGAASEVPDTAGSVEDIIGSIAGQISGIPESSDSEIIGSGEVTAPQNEEKGALSDFADRISGIFGGISAAQDTQAPADQQEIPADQQEIPADTANSGMMVGGWKINTETVPQLSEEEEEIFKKAETTLAGGAYTPVAVIATQLVAGTNYAYLCLGAPDDQNDPASWYIVALYKDLSGNVTTMSIKDIELNNIETVNNIYNPAFVGSWTAKVPEESTSVLPEDAQAAFDAATSEYVGVGYTPIALLATQVVAGLNYKLLCYGTLATSNPVTSWYVLDIYKDLQGNASITDAQLFDLNDYISYGESDDQDDIIDDPDIDNEGLDDTAGE